MLHNNFPCLFLMAGFDHPSSRYDIRLKRMRILKHRPQIAELSGKKTDPDFKIRHGIRQAFFVRLNDGSGFAMFTVQYQ
jgi:hypothetical protein